MPEPAPSKVVPLPPADAAPPAPGVGPKTAARLRKLGLVEQQDFLFHLPHRYQDRTRVTPIGALRPGMEALIVGRIELSSVAYGRGRSLVTRISDGTGTANMRLFHFNNWQQRSLGAGRWITCYGEVRPGAGAPELIHPEYNVSGKRPECTGETALTPVYPATEGVSQRVIRRLVDEALSALGGTIRDLLPADVIAAAELPTLADALRTVHRPRVEDLPLLEGHRHRAQLRLAFEELLAHHLGLRRIRERRRRHRAPVIEDAGRLWPALQQNLGFRLTGAQRRVVAEVLADLARPVPAMRLVQGDVGSGKTVVAAAAALAAVEAGYQVALMAPTELLAEQHLDTFRRWLDPLGVQVEWLAGKLTAYRRRAALAQVAAGVPVVVGTHALYQEGVEFRRLGLIIVDEQHRFGVDQRLALRRKGETGTVVPHQLTMSATPIPRSLAMVFYADLDVSSIDELPPGRQPIRTVVVAASRRNEVQRRVRDGCRAGRQAYWVCPLIDESETLQAQAATETEARLREAFPGLRVGLVHGRMRAPDKDAVMRRFRDADIDLLVATTVIEVGVDVPNASLMIIENAERLGLSQLHQLRGRVGRGAEAASCVLMYDGPLTDAARARLHLMRRTHDGFEIARHDLEARGPGEFLGTRQTGQHRLAIADLVRDRHLLPQIEAAGRQMLKDYPDRVEPLVRRWVRSRDDYAHV